jgi:tripartite-type tricarboxylate transporter receptor subunit TctC
MGKETQMANMIAALRSVVLCVAMCGVTAGAAFGQAYPSKPVHIIVPLGAGSSTDIVARLVAQGITEETGQAVVVENRPGADGMLGARSVVTARPDGYTILVSSSTHVINVHLYKSLGYDPLRDFAPVATLVEFPMYLFVSANSPYKSVEDIVQRAKQQPGSITFASASATQRLMGEMLQQKASVRMVNAPYRTTAAALTDLAAGGLIDVLFTDAASAKGQWQAGRVRPLAVGGSKRVDSSRDIPTVDEAGVKGYDLVGSWFGAWAPAQTPAAVVSRLNTLFANAMKTKRVQEALAAAGIQPLVMSPDEFARFQASETEKMGRVVKAAGIEPQ